MNKNTLLTNMLVIVCFSSVFVNAQTDPNNWEKLNLNSTTIAGTKVYYEKSFEPNLPFFEQKYKEFLTQKSKVDLLKSKNDLILADIDSILGIKEPNTVERNIIFNKMLEVISSIEVHTFYLVKKSTIKDFLIAGGKLPNLSYNKDKDLVESGWQFAYTSKEGFISNEHEITFPITSNEMFEKDIENAFQAIQTAFIDYLFVPIHEIAEMSFFMRIKSGNPYLRWFGEGFANTAAYELAKKYIGEKDANNFLTLLDVKQYEDIQKEINLNFWLSADCSILPGDMPNKAGKRISSARYAYSTFEVQRLVNKYGKECIRGIVDEFSSKSLVTGNDLLQTIKNVTGEDMQLRLEDYQDFKKLQDGLKKYLTALKEANSKKDYEQMAYNIFRLHDLYFEIGDQELFNDYRNAANCLFRMGMEKEADLIMSHFIDFLSSSKLTNSRTFALETFIIYAFDTGKPLKAKEYAEELLKTKPDNEPALTTKIMVLLSDNQIFQAKEIAQQIIKNSKSKETPGYQIASQVIAIDPNQIKPTP